MTIATRPGGAIPTTARQVHAYARAVVAGNVVANRYVRLAAKRHLADLERAETRGWRFDGAKAERAIAFFGFLRLAEGPFEGKPFDLQAWQAFIVGSLFGWYTQDADGTWVRRFRNAYVETGKGSGKTPMAAGIGLYGMVADDEGAPEIYCLDPATRVLTGDLAWRPVGELAVGDDLLAFDEEPPSRAQRKFRRARVTSADRIRQPAYRVTLRDGRQVIASGAHRWLGRTRGRAKRQLWIRTDQLRPGVLIRNLGRPWDAATTNDAGYLAGVFDGEAAFHGRGYGSGFRIAFAQKPGSVLDRVRRLVTEAGYAISPIRAHASGVATFEIRSAYECLRFLGEVGPIRLLENAPAWYEGRTPNRGGHVEVTAVEPLGEREVVAIGTSTKTLFAEGLFSHNSAAKVRHQAAILWTDAKRMVEKSPVLAGRVEVGAHALSMPSRNAMFTAVSSEARNLHGPRVHIGLIDEEHALPDDEVINAMRAGTKGRRNALILRITNSGYDRHSVCWADHEYSINILEGVLTDDAWFAFVCGLDACDEHRRGGAPIDGCPGCDQWTDERVWPKANPNIGVSLPIRYLREMVTEALGKPSAANSVKRLCFCIWTEGAGKWLDVARFAELADVAGPDPLPPERRAYGGLDVASTVDLTAFALVAPRETCPADGHTGRCYDLRLRFWLPDLSMRERVRRDHVPYDLWAREGWITLTPGDRVDHQFLVRDITAQGNARTIGVDRWETKGFLTPALQGAGFVHHDGNPVLRWMVAKAVASGDAAGNIKPDRERSSEKIDGVAAWLDALYTWAAQPADEGLTEVEPFIFFDDET